MSRRSDRLVFVFLAVHVAFLGYAQSPKWKAWQVEADTLYNRQEYAEAAKRYTKILAANRNKEGKYTDRSLYSIVYKRAVCYYSTQKFDNALKDIEVFALEFPNAPQPKLLSAFIYRELDDVDNQLSNLEEAMELQPPNPDFLKWRGLLYVQKKNYSGALTDLLDAKQFQDDTEVETYLGLCYFNRDERDSAFMSFDKAIELDPTFLAPYLYASSMALQIENYPLSLEYANLALRLESKNKEALFYKGVALVKSDRLDDGCRCLNRSFYAGFDDAGDYLSEYCFKSGN